MVGLPACIHFAMKRRRYKKKPYRPIDKDQFREIRLMQRLTVDDVAKLLQVTARTVAHWECGSTRIPYSAFKLLRCLANGELVSEAWKGWTVKGDTLWSPVGRAFRVYELTYLQNYFTMARYWQADYAKRSEQRQCEARPVLRLVVNQRPVDSAR